MSVPSCWSKHVDGICFSEISRVNMWNGKSSTTLPKRLYLNFISASPSPFERCSKHIYTFANKSFFFPFSFWLEWIVHLSQSMKMGNEWTKANKLGDHRPFTSITFKYMMVNLSICWPFHCLFIRDKFILPIDKTREKKNEQKFSWQPSK